MTTRFEFAEGKFRMCIASSYSVIFLFFVIVGWLIIDVGEIMSAGKIYNMGFEGGS